MFTTALVGVLGCTALAAHDAPKHPVISEILYHVPLDHSDESIGDANQDGERDATGDEFVELYNPYDEAIELTGYTITDAHPNDKNRFAFTFPKVKLEPGQTALVFNGNNQRFANSTGDEKHAGKPQENFNDAYVFDAGNDNRYIGFANTGDGVALYAPDGDPISFVWWGESSAEIPKGCPIVDEAPTTSKGSVSFDEDEAEWRAHPGRVPYSPGVHPPS